MPNETETKWTPMQKAAISAHGASLVVSAAAGSGKTAVLVERIIRLLANEETGCKAENMIVATFTNDAHRFLPDHFLGDLRPDLFILSRELLHGIHLFTHFPVSFLSTGHCHCCSVSSR